MNNDINIRRFDKMVEYGIVSTIDDEKKIIMQINKYLRSKEIKNLRKETNKSMLKARYPFNYNYYYWQGTKRGSIGQGSIWHLELLANKDVNGKMQFPEREDIAFFFLVIKHGVNSVSKEINDGRDKFFQGLIEAIDFPVEVVYNYAPYEERRNNKEYLEYLFEKDFEEEKEITKDFLCNTKIKKNEFESLNIKFFNEEEGFLCDVVKWTKINDCTLKDLDDKFVTKFLGELEKFRAYYVIAENYDTGNLIVIHKSTGEVCELEHEVTEEVVRYFINSSFAQMYDSLKCFKKIKSKIIKLKEQEKIEEIELLFKKAKKSLSSIDSKVVINDDEYNRQFWNEILGSYKEWCLD